MVLLRLNATKGFLVNLTVSNWEDSICRNDRGKARGARRVRRKKLEYNQLVHLLAVF